jgi:hypothetical protein
MFSQPGSRKIIISICKIVALYWICQCKHEEIARSPVSHFRGDEGRDAIFCLTREGGYPESITQLGIAVKSGSILNLNETAF